MPKVADDFDKTIYNHTKIMELLKMPKDGYRLCKSDLVLSLDKVMKVEKAAEELTQTNYKLMSKIDKLEKIINGMLREVPGVMLSNALHESERKCKGGYNVGTTCKT